MKSNIFDAYEAPGGKIVQNGTTLDSLFIDDFGGTVIDTVNNWDVIDGGQVVGSVINGSTSAVKIGSGITGITHSVASSTLTVAMGTTLGAEKWFLSKQVFGGKEDILVLLNKSQPITANSIFIGLCEVDPITFLPMLNPNFAADGNGAFEFTNRGGVEFGLTATTTAFQTEAIGDSSPSKASGAVGVAGAALTTTQEYLIEVDARDIIASSAAIDSVAAKATGASRVSSQSPNDKKLYKLIMRFRNVTAPTATSVVIQRVLVVDNYESRVQISSGEGDFIGAKAIGVNIVGGAVAQSTSVANGSGWYVAPDNILVAEITSAAITATATTNGVALPRAAGGAAQFNIIVTAVSGTTPTMDVGIEESDDTGTNWYRIYDFPRITVTGAYRSPLLPLTGNRLRYVQTIAGTTPSFTRAINRVAQYSAFPLPYRQIIDRALAVNTLNSTTALSLKTNTAKNLSMTLNMGAITTTAPAIQLQGSDDNGASWYNIGSPLTGVASSTVALTINSTHVEMVRGLVSTAGVGATLGSLTIKAFG